MPAALAVFDADRRLAGFNTAFADLGLFPKSLLKAGCAFAEFQRRDASLKRRGSGPHEVSLPGGQVLRVGKRSLPKRRLLLCYENVTAARLAAERLDLVTRASSEGTYDWDIVNDTIYYSDRVYEAIGLRRKDIPDANAWYERIHPDDRPRYSERLRAHFRGETDRFEVEIRFRGPKGDWRWARQHGIGIRDVQGKVVRMVGSTGDIDRLKRLEHSLAESEARYALATQAATEGIYDWNVGTGTLYLSDRAKAFFSIKDRKLTPEAWNSRIHPDDFPRYRNAMARYFRGETPQFEHEYRIKSASGGYDWIEDRAVAERARTGRVFRLVGAITDISLRKQAVLELQRAHEETAAALERQTATAEILKVISASPTDVQPVFDAITSSVARLFGRKAALRSVENDGLRRRARSYEPAPGEFHGPEIEPLDRRSIVGRAVIEGRALQWADTLVDGAAQYGLERARSLAFRSIASAPLMLNGKAIGVISVSSPQPGTLSDKQMELLTTFADQAVIAIENVRLFNETKEALERQTATAEILAAMSDSMTDAQPVFDAIVRNLRRLFNTRFAVVQLLRGGMIEMPAADGEPGFERLRDYYPRPRDDTTIGEQTMTARRVLQSSPIIGNPDAAERTQAFAREFGFDAVLFAPMLRGDTVIGVIGIAHGEPRVFDDKEVALIKAFADQAVIAIENVRLFNETKEALERQTATAEILKVIAASPSDVQPVFDAIAASARSLLAGGAALVARRAGDKLELVAYTSAGEVADAALRRLFPSSITGQGHMGRAILTAAPAGISDIQNDASYSEAFRASAKARGVRSVVSVPMLREGEPIGVISVNRPVAGSFSEHQTNLLRTFADQAVIAIENVRLFNELKARTEALTRSVGQLTALGEVGQTISSTLDVETVLKTIVSHAMRLTGLDAGVIYEYDIATGRFQLRASENFDDESVATLRGAELRVGEGAVGTSVSARKPTQVPDTHAPDYPVRLREMLDRSGFRAVLAVPLLREEQIIGALMMLRRAPGPFPEEVVELLRTFASQSALAIQNARLFREIEDKGRELEVANQHKSDFLANMSHELRTPLNAIIGFSEALDERYFGELTDKQAEYVKDIHGSGKHLLSLINDILDLSKIEAGRMDLDLAEFDLPGAIDNALTLVRERAQRHGLRLEHELDPALGTVTADERKVKQILLNLLSNAVKFTPEGGQVTVRARQHGDLLEVDVVDTGVGIASEDQAAVFEEFKQVGTDIAAKAQGTGLGLALTKRFVELHGGTIGLESAPGKGTTFTFTLPVRGGE